MASIKFVTLKGNDLDVRVNVSYITAYTYDNETNETVVWLLGRKDPLKYPNDQRHEINMAIAASA